jgi:hypothetical protein
MPISHRRGLNGREGKSASLYLHVKSWRDHQIEMIHGVREQECLNLY